MKFKPLCFLVLLLILEPTVKAYKIVFLPDLCEFTVQFILSLYKAENCSLLIQFKAFRKPLLHSQLDKLEF